MESIPLVDGVEVVRTSVEEIHPISENEIDATLPRNLADKDEALTDMLWDRVAAFANSRTIQLSLPKMTGEELNRGMEEGKIFCMFGYSYLFDFKPSESVRYFPKISSVSPLLPLLVEISVSVFA